MSDVAIVIGHHPDAPGAAMKVGGGVVHEYDLWAPFAEVLAKNVNVDAEVVERPNKLPDEDLALKVNDTGADAAIELHFNASSEKTASGTEMLYYPGSEGGRDLAKMLHKHTLGALGLPDRGLKRKKFAFLEMTTMPAVIAEPAFATCDEDAKALVTGLPDLIGAYSTALEYFVGGVS